MQVAIFSCLGLGDGLLISVLAHNLAREGHGVTLFHPFLKPLQPQWFPSFQIEPFTAGTEVELSSYDRLFIVYERTPWMEALLKEALLKYRDKTTVLNPIATPNRDYPFWEEGGFDGNLTFAENLFLFCRDKLHLKEPVRECGIFVPPTRGRYPKRVVIHPTSSKPSKNWTKRQFLKLGKELAKRGFDPVFVVSPKEKSEWEEGIAFESLSDLFLFVAESGSMIGNDSGLGHLASAFGLPSVVLCRNERTKNFWRPGWAPGVALVPSGWIPNIKGLRWRDKYWQWGISVGSVLRAHRKLLEETARHHEPRFAP